MARAHRLCPLALLLACSDYDISATDKDNAGAGDTAGSEEGGDGNSVNPPAACEADNFPPEEIGYGDTCPEEPPGGFEPVLEWEYGEGEGCLSLPVVGDIDQDGDVEVVVNITDWFNGPGDLVVLEGNGGAEVWRDSSARLGFGSPPALADLDRDGDAEIIVVKEYASSLLATGDYTAVAYDHSGEEVWESEHFVGLDFDYGTAPSVSDMNHDGSPEIVLGRVILDSEGNTLGVGEYGRGSYGVVTIGGFSVSESSVSAVADLDLDGEEEVIVGNAMYAMDGTAIWSDSSQDDGMISIANFDDDPEGEFVAITYNSVRVVDTDGTIIWGPFTFPEPANILAPAAVADLDLDGMPEVATAGGNVLMVFNHDGSVLWTHAVTDESGATGASVFDFEGDGVPELVYIDEVEMIAFDGPTGGVKFYTEDHGSNTMFDYPVIADLDGDDHAEALVCHNFFRSAMSVYQDATNSWASARPVWNQHAYSVNNINDDLTVPEEPAPAFTEHNSWHSALASSGEVLGFELEADILEVCEDECGEGWVYVTARVRNLSEEEVAAGVSVALYARSGGTDSLLATGTTAEAIPGGWAGSALVFRVEADALAGAEALWFQADDDGTGTGAVAECAESNNGFQWSAEEGSFCAD